MSGTACGPVRFINLFAGIGGIRLGFERAFRRHETVFVSEWDTYAQATYRTNFPTPAEIAGDITKISEKDVPPFDVCLAGFPCQAFSLAGRRMGFQNSYKGGCRGTLFQDVVRKGGVVGVVCRAPYNRRPENFRSRSVGGHEPQ